MKAIKLNKRQAEKVIREIKRNPPEEETCIIAQLLIMQDKDGKDIVLVAPITLTASQARQLQGILGVEEGKMLPKIVMASENLYEA